jgi:hypothetical protein
VHEELTQFNHEFEIERRAMYRARAALRSFFVTSPLRVIWFAFLAIALCPRSSAAQQEQRLELTEIGQIADLLIDSLLPPDRLLSRVSVAQRGIFFNHTGTSSLFGHDTAGVALGALQLRNRVLTPPNDLLADCVHLRNCQRIGWRISFNFQPLSVTSSEVEVRAWVNWNDRGGEQYVEGVTPAGRSLLVGFATDITFVRSPDGKWLYGKQGRVMVF